MLARLLVSLFSITSISFCAQVEPFEVLEQKAIESKKPIMMVFLGSGWCYWCDELKLKVLTKNEFLRSVQKDFILVTLDFPRSLSATEAENTYKNRFGVVRFPSIVIYDPKTKNLFEESGYRNMQPKEYARWLKRKFYFKDSREPLIGYGNFRCQAYPISNEPDTIQEDNSEESIIPLSNLTENRQVVQLGIDFGGGWVKRMKRSN